MASDPTKDGAMIELSIIIPTCNRVDRLRACLESLCHQTQPAADFEVVVVVDGSTDGTSEMLADFTPPYTLRVIWQGNSGQCVARNSGVWSAQGRFCLLLDDDIVADPRLVAEHLRVQRECQGVIGIGQMGIKLPPDADWFARGFEKGWIAHYAELNQGARVCSWMDAYSGNISMPRKAFLEVGGFAVDLLRSFDVELAYRLERHGLSCVFIPEALGTQDERKGFHELASDAEKIGASCAELYRRHPPMLPELLGSFNDMGMRLILLRRLLLALDVSPRLLGMMGWLLGKRFRQGGWFSFVYSYCYWRGVRKTVPDRDTWRRLTHGTPILLYHAIGDANEPASRFIIPERRFALQMLLLKWLRYHVLNLEEFLRYQREYCLPPARSVVITIDDGYADNLTRAYPVLRRHGFPATLFLVSGHVGATNQWDRDGALTGRPLLNWPDIRELRRGGIVVGAHTRTHPMLTDVSPERARQEIAGCQEDLERELGVPVRLFSYPYGEYDSSIEALVAQSGLLGACGVRPGMNYPATPSTALHRTEIYGTDTFLRFVLNLWLGDSEAIVRRGDISGDGNRRKPPHQ